MVTNNVKINLRGNINVVEKSASKRIIAGYASVSILDSENDLISKEVLLEGIRTLLTDYSYSNLMLSHTNLTIGKIVPSYGKLKTHVDDKGLFIVGEIRQDLETANEVWDMVVDGQLRGFSISGEVIEEHNECNEQSCFNVIDKINIFEVSLCQYPVNKLSGFVVVSKSNVNCSCGKHEELIIKDDVCDCSVKDNKRDMTEEENIQENEDEQVEENLSEESQEQEQTSEDANELQDLIETLASRMNAIEKIVQELAESEDDEMPEDEDEEEDEPEDEEDEEEMSGEFDIDKTLESIAEAFGVEVTDISDALAPFMEQQEGSDSESNADIEKAVNNVEAIASNLNKIVKRFNKSLDKLDEKLESINEEPEEQDDTEDEQEETEEVTEETNEEVEMAIKAKDDTIKNLEEEIIKLKEQVKSLEEAEQEPQTVNDNEPVIEKDSGIKVHRGTVYFKDD